MAAGSDHIRRMMEQVQNLPPEAAEGKQQTYDTFLKVDFGLKDNERAMFEWGPARRIWLSAI